MNGLLLCGFAMVAFVAVSSSTLCTPDQWEGYQGSLTGYVYDKKYPGMVKQIAYLSYDYKNLQLSEFVTTIAGDTDVRMQILMKYTSEKEGTLYAVNLKEQKCTVSKVTTPFGKACIPESAKHVADYSLGLLGSGGLKVSSYSMKVKELEVVVAVSKINANVAIPITEYATGHQNKTDLLAVVGFSNITPGIKNTTIFEVPKACQHAQEIDLSESALGQFGILGQ